jgi:dephospho-CoA kinase
MKFLVPIAYARGGKDEFAKVAAEFGYQRIALADALKQEAEKMLERPIDKKQDRVFLIALGKMRRERHKDYWIERLQNTIKQHILDGVQKFVLTDCRFPNEYQWMKDAGATFVRVESWPNDRIARGMNPELMNDESESYIPTFKCDFSIMNDTSLEDYHERVRRFIRFFETDF